MAEIEAGFSVTVFPEAPVRAEELRFVVRCLRQGQCCAIVGPSNTGKSLLLKSLLKEEVRRACVPEGVRPPLTVFVDYLQPVDSEPAFYELMLRCIVPELQRAQVTPSTTDTLRARHQELLRSTTDLAARFLFESAIRELGHEKEIRLVVILDEFDDVFRTLPAGPFRQLRVLRDALGEKLCYVTATSRHLERLRSDKDTYEFVELFHLHTWVLCPLTDDDCRRFVAYLAGKQGVVLSEEFAGRLVGLSGGHPGLLERLFTVLQTSEPEPGASWQDRLDELSQMWPVQQECRRLWDELEEEEHEGLLALVEGSKAVITADQWQALEAKGLAVIGESGDRSIFSPVFEVFVQEELNYRRRTAQKGVHGDPGTGQIWVDGREVTLELSELQRKLLMLLCRKAGAVCTHSEIIEEIYGHPAEGVTPGAIYELVKRVRRNVEPDWRKPRYIVTVRGGGYRLQRPS